jgi:hypothetical protein
MDEAAPKQEEKQSNLSGYHRIKNAPDFGALMRVRRTEERLSIREIRETVNVTESVISCVERADQTVFRADIIDKIRAVAVMLGIENALVTTELTHAQWRHHSRPYKRTPTKAKAKAKAAERQEREEQKRLEQEARVREAVERKKQWESQQPGRMWIPDTSNVRPPVTPTPPPPETFPDLNDQMGQIKLFIRLNTKGIMSDAALVVALRDLLRGGGK